MRIGVIAYELEGARSGVGRYLEGLLRGVLELGGDRHRWHLFMKGERPASFSGDEELFEAPAIETHFDGRPGARPIFWEQTRLPFLLRRAGVDAVFSPGYSLPAFTPVPQVVTLHDLSFEHLRGEFRWREGLRRRLLARQAAKRAARVLVDTETMAEDLHRTYGVERSKIGVVPLAVDRRFFAANDSTRFDVAELGVRTPYLLFLGSILPRRRLDLVIDAFAHAAPEEMQLVIAGRDRLPTDGQLRSWIDASPATERILRLDYAPEESLLALYAGAEATVYLSSYEGYGLPPLESIAAGTATLTSPGMALDDLLPDYPYRSELAPEAVARTLEHLLADPQRDQIVASSRETLRRLTWNVCAELFLEELEIAIRRLR